jgi:hypothetical protein
MLQVADNKKLFALSAIGALLSLLFAFLGAPFLRLIRSVYGAKTYWSIGVILFAVLMGLTLFPMAFLLGSCWLVVGIYTEFEQRGFASFWVAFLSVLISATFLVGGTVLSAKMVGIDVKEDIQKSVDGLLVQLKAQSSNTASSAASDKGEGTSLLNGLQVDGKLILSQIPSIAIVLLIISLAYGLMMESRIASAFRLPYEKVASQIKLLDFRIPDAFVWLTMISFLGSFMKLGNENLSYAALNLFNVMLGLYFFQGLAVMEVFLRAFRAGPILRFLVYFVVVFQLFFILSAVGFVDYWVDFRKRLRNLRAKQRNNSGEHV